MGFGDEIIASGLAKGAKARGKRIAFGEHGRIIWSQQSHEIFRGNPNVATPGSERQNDVEWIKYFRGHRLYARTSGGRWIFDDKFRCPEGEIFFTDTELDFGKSYSNFVVLEPRVKPRGACAGVNKQWGVQKYQQLAEALQKMGWLSLQVVPPNQMPLLHDVRAVRTQTFRHALAVIKHAQLYVGPEGGLHHGAAAVGTPAVVIFGGFNSPKSTGYGWHTNISVGEPCGNIAECAHCKEAMRSISVQTVLDAAMKTLEEAGTRQCMLGKV